MEKNNKKVTILLSFGRKKSPAKVSEYHLDLNKIDIKNPHNTEPLIDLRNENLLFSEKKEQLGATRESTLKVALGRIPNR